MIIPDTDNMLLTEKECQAIANELCNIMGERIRNLIEKDYFKKLVGEMGQSVYGFIPVNISGLFICISAHTFSRVTKQMGAKDYSSELILETIIQLAKDSLKHIKDTNAVPFINVKSKE